jgi:leader peptidase (prepilin peptidase) / N-methyltransferase
MFRAIFDPHYWAVVPFHFWSAVMFALGSIVGSFLNVCIHRLPRNESVISPPSHCPHCKYSIPFYLNIPLVTWVYLRGKCKNCGAPISIRYFLVELLTALTFLGCWLCFGRQSVALAVIYSIFLSGLIVATATDFEHIIIPDEISIGGMVAGFIFSFLVPSLQGKDSTLKEAMASSLFGMAVGAGSIYALLRGGKLVFGRKRRNFSTDTRIIFAETDLILPATEPFFARVWNAVTGRSATNPTALEAIPYGEILYRENDTIQFHATTLELVDRCYKNVPVRVTQDILEIGEEKIHPATVVHMEAHTSKIILPQEAMGLGDVKFMGAIGAFLGWKAVIFTLVVSSFIGGFLVGIPLVLMGKRGLSSKLPYGPYLAAAAAIWVFAGPQLVQWYLNLMMTLFQSGPIYQGDGHPL